MKKKESAVFYVLMLVLFQDRTTASWMLVCFYLVLFPFIKIKNRSFSNLTDKYLSGGGIADVKVSCLVLKVDGNFGARHPKHW